MAHQHLRAETDAEQRLLLLQRHVQPADLGLDEIVGIVGAHRAAEDDGAGMVGKRGRQCLPENRAADVKRIALFGEQLADTAGAGALLMQHDQHRALALDAWARLAGIAGRRARDTGARTVSRHRLAPPGCR
ncbi:hypothetical protein GGQ67_004594 [Rhizobium metallidurans]|uniref:Uncharacterized protein n=1 Tax=Rhizobium metallidurans TaxID=1265931 RepID=A0A7W6CUY8_9HYPH|nr:hypothetical protein [Rhizobium metallidurans]